MGAQSEERKGSNFAAQRSGAIVQKPEGPNTYDSKNLAIAIWQPCLARVERVYSHVEDLRVELLVGLSTPVREHRVAVVHNGLPTLLAAGKTHRTNCQREYVLVNGNPSRWRLYFVDSVLI